MAAWPWTPRTPSRTEPLPLPHTEVLPKPGEVHHPPGPPEDRGWRLQAAAHTPGNSRWVLAPLAASPSHPSAFWGPRRPPSFSLLRRSAVLCGGARLLLDMGSVPMTERCPSFPLCDRSPPQVSRGEPPQPCWRVPLLPQPHQQGGLSECWIFTELLGDKLYLNFNLHFSYYEEVGHLLVCFKGLCISFSVTVPVFHQLCYWVGSCRLCM